MTRVCDGEYEMLMDTDAGIHGGSVSFACSSSTGKAAQKQVRNKQRHNSGYSSASIFESRPWSSPTNALRPGSPTLLPRGYCVLPGMLSIPGEIPPA